MDVDDYGVDEQSRTRIQSSVQALVKRYGSSVDFSSGSLRKDLKIFYMLTGFSSWNIKNSLRVSLPRCEFHILTVEVFYEIARTSKYHSEPLTVQECQLYGYARLANNPGRVLIRPEKLRDKIIEWVAPKEVDFPHHKEFSRKYYVLAESPARVRNILSKIFLDEMCRLRNVILEVAGGAVLLTARKIISPEETLRYCLFFEKILRAEA